MNFVVMPETYVFLLLLLFSRSLSCFCIIFSKRSLPFFCMRSSRFSVRIVEFLFDGFAGFSWREKKSQKGMTIREMFEGVESLF